MTLSAYLLAALVCWLGIPADDASPGRVEAWAALYHEPPAETFARAEQLAEALAQLGEQAPRRALELAAVAVEETRLKRWAVEGACNSPTWRREHRADLACDGGHAWGAFQVHPGEGLDRVVGHHVAPAELLGSAGAAPAWALYARNPAGWTTLPLALEKARRWAAGHPWEAR